MMVLLLKCEDKENEGIFWEFNIVNEGRFLVLMTLSCVSMKYRISIFAKNQSCVKRYNEQPDKMTEVIHFVRNSGGLEYTKNVMHQYKDDAFEILATTPDCPARSSLEDLVNFVTEREK